MKNENNDKVIKLDEIYKTPRRYGIEINSLAYSNKTDKTSQYFIKVH